jgi:uncharacterized membrane protein
MRKVRLNDLLVDEEGQLKKLSEIVHQAIEEEKLLSEKILDFEDKHLSISNKISDKVAKFGGSWSFIISFLGIMLVWIMVNVVLLSNPFDAYPFILLNLILSSIAALQAPIIMMSQNRKEEKDRARAINDYMINLKAEIEVRNLHGKIDLLMTEQMMTLFKIQATQVDMMNEIKNEIVNTPKK